MSHAGIVVCILSIGTILAAACSESQPDFPVVVMETSEGVIELELFPNVAPVTVETFLKLVDEGFYDSLKFHRVIEGFMIQSGDPMSAGRQPADFTVVNEANDSLHHQGSLAMARRQDPNSASTQFYICVGESKNFSYLDSLKYTVFGRVSTGMDVALRIGKVPTSGSVGRIRQDSLWRSRLLDLQQRGEADVILAGRDFPMWERPLQPVYILKAYRKQ